MERGVCQVSVFRAICQNGFRFLINHVVGLSVSVCLLSASDMYMCYMPLITKMCDLKKILTKCNVLSCPIALCASSLFESNEIQVVLACK